MANTPLLPRRPLSLLERAWLFAMGSQAKLSGRVKSSSQLSMLVACLVYAQGHYHGGWHRHHYVGSRWQQRVRPQRRAFDQTSSGSARLSSRRTSDGPRLRARNFLGTSTPCLNQRLLRLRLMPKAHGNESSIPPPLEFWADLDDRIGHRWFLLLPELLLPSRLPPFHDLRL
jgi:hypothetical protein